MPRSDLMFPDDGRRPSRQDRGLLNAKSNVKNEVELAAWMLDGAAALAGHFMEVALDLDEKRRDLAGADEMTNMLMAEAEATFIRQAKRIQSNLYSQWKLG